MDDTVDVIRQQMEETKSQLSEKLESLEQQVSETVQSTGTAVNATVEAVQETVETVTEAVHDAVKSVTNAFDLERQIDRHPWLVVGGAVVLGYLAAGYLAQPAESAERSPAAPPQPSPSAENGHQAAAESSTKSSFWREMRGVALGALVVIVRDVAARAIPQVLSALSEGQAGARIRPTTQGNTVFQEGKTRRTA